MHLSQKAFERARTFIHTHARPLEQALFAFHFESGSRNAVLDALAAFQHDTGGFGYALEPDMRLPDASPIATTIAFQIMRDIDTPPDHPMIVNGIRYLLSTYNPDLDRWPLMPPEVNAHPHAPWWTFDPEREKPAGFRANPSAEIVGHLWHYRVHVPTDFLLYVTGKAQTLLETLPDDMDMHDLLCYLWLLEADNLPDDERHPIRNKLKKAAQAIVTRDPEKWTGYAVRPLWLAPRPASPLADLLTEDIRTNLDYDIAHQGDDGAWPPFWSWPGDAWPDARREWKGVLTVKTLSSFKAFGRL